MPERIGRYTVARRLGSGGMGEVFLAYSPAGAPVAVKLIRTDRLDPVTRARFEKEARVARDVVGTRGVARFLDADPYADRPWMAMEYVAGHTLLETVDEAGILPELLVASLGALLAEGLGAVHTAGLLHRDLKPQNVILGEYGPVIIDFGLAAFADTGQDTLSHSGMIVGTVRCMSPEQAAGHPHVTPAADVYALGTVLLYAAAGHYPYDGSRWEAIVAQVSSPMQQPDLSGVPESLLPLLTAMLAHEPATRPTLTEVAERCTALMTSLGVSPVSARRALIARTTATAAGAAEADVPTVEVEDRLRALLTAPSPASPLDTGVSPGAASPNEEITDEQAADPPEAPAEAAPAKKPTPHRPRVPASQRIAQELREAYAMQSTL
ncbi:serine/threonine-protein kinase [Kitasatospora sp. NPDC051914]|uniref:serine/threonine-protein kinase n=1 Tax=Kitasatospora sp. NPDC051914 TaxID=3154945 RepID=UPI00342866CC